MKNKKQTYLVFPSNGGPATSCVAEKAVIEPSGVLALYEAGEDGKDSLIKAFAVNEWKTVERQKSNA